MTSNSRWRSRPAGEQKSLVVLCPTAAELERKLLDMIFSHLNGDVQKLTRGQISQAKYLLQEEYQTFKKAIGPGHFGRIGGHHKCVQTVYDEAYEKLHIIDIRLRPAVDLIGDYGDLVRSNVAPPPPPAVNEIAGIFFGETDENV